MKKLMGLIVLLALTGCGTSISGVPLPSFEPTTPAPTIAPQPLVEDQVENPSYVEIPSISASSDLIPTGLDDNGKLEVPPVGQPEQASWYEGFPEPGESGRPAVILGHVDGHGKKGVFFNLKNVKPNDVVIVDDKEFTVYKVEIYPKQSFPGEAVYTPNEHPELRLITCGGTFGGDRAGHYDDNVVVYARLALDTE